MNRCNQRCAGALVAAGVLGCATGAWAATIGNGSFELCSGCSTAPKGYEKLHGGATQLTDWTVIGTRANAAVDWVNTSFWNADDGSYSLALRANTVGGVEQSFSTVVGRT